MSGNLKRTFALAALMAGASGVANATEGWYGRGDVGYSLGGEVDLATTNSDPSLEDEWTQSIGMGYAYSNGFRLEGELSHRFNKLEPEGTVTGDDVHAWAMMLNGILEFNHDGAIHPYVGLGAGLARINLRTTGVPATSDNDSVFAYQGLAGLAFDLSEQWTADIGFRHFVANEGRYLTTDADYTNDSVTLGLRYQFQGAPPPPPVIQTPPPPPPVVRPPPPPVCPTSEFVVYFEWDRSNLNQAALETIDAAVARARQCNIAGLTVAGHTDTSGSTAYNAGLSERRASVVRDALVARGIGAGSISTQARGEADLARATRDGVREPLNRRTAVTISFR